MLTITTTTGSNKNGATVVIAKGAGKQRTIQSDPSRSAVENHGAAAGTLLAVLMDDRQRAMLLHPTGGQRYQMESVSDAGGKYRHTLNV